MAKIEIVIELGNDAMRDGVDVSDALIKLADSISSYTADWLERASGTLHVVKDANGNRVGQLKVKP